MRWALNINRLFLNNFIVLRIPSNNHRPLFLFSRCLWIIRWYFRLPKIRHKPFSSSKLVLSFTTRSYLFDHTQLWFQIIFITRQYTFLVLIPTIIKLSFRYIRRTIKIWIHVLLLKLYFLLFNLNSLLAYSFY